MRCYWLDTLKIVSLNGPLIKLLLVTMTTSDATFNPIKYVEYQLPQHYCREWNVIKGRLKPAAFCYFVFVSLIFHSHVVHISVCGIQSHLFLRRVELCFYIFVEIVSHTIIEVNNRRWLNDRFSWQEFAQRVLHFFPANSQHVMQTTKIPLGHKKMWNKFKVILPLALSHLTDLVQFPACNLWIFFGRKNCCHANLLCVRCCKAPANFSQFFPRKCTKHICPATVSKIT